MTFPIEYYLDTVSMSLTFSYVPSGYLDPSQLSSGKPFGHMESIDSKEKNNRKVIILNTPTPLYSRELSHIHALLLDGFRVFQVLDSQLMPIEALHQVITETNEYLSEKQLKEQLQKQHPPIEYHDTLVLGNEQFNKISGYARIAYYPLSQYPGLLDSLSSSACVSLWLDGPIDPRLIKKVNYVDIPEQEYSLDINTLATQLRDKIVGFYLRYPDPNNLGYQLLQCSQFNPASVKEVECAIQDPSSASDCLRILHQRMPHIRSLSISCDAKMTSTEPINVDFEGGFTALNALQINDATDVNDYFPLVEQYHTQLVSLKLHFSPHNKKILSLGLPHLEHLRIEVNQDIQHQDIQHITRHKHLKSLTLFAKISDQQLFELLNALPELEALELKLESLDGPEVSQSTYSRLLPLKNLKKLKIYATISGACLGTLLNATPALTFLEPSRIISDLPQLKPLMQLTRIEARPFILQNMSTHNYFTLLSIAPNLVSPIRWYPTESIPSPHEKIPTPNLTYITDVDILRPFELRYLKQLIHGCPRLKTITFDLRTSQSWTLPEGLNTILTEAKLEKIIIKNSRLTNNEQYWSEIATCAPSCEISNAGHIINISNLKDIPNVIQLTDNDCTMIYTPRSSFLAARNTIASALAHLSTASLILSALPTNLPTLHPDSRLYSDTFTLYVPAEDAQVISPQKLSPYLHENLHQLHLEKLIITDPLMPLNAQNLTSVTLDNVTISLENLDILLEIINRNRGKVTLKNCIIQVNKHDALAPQNTQTLLSNLKKQYPNVEFLNKNNIRLEAFKEKPLLAPEPEEIYTIYHAAPKKKQNAKKFIEQLQSDIRDLNASNQTEQHLEPWAQKSLLTQLTLYLKKTYGEALDPHILKEINTGICAALAEFCAHTLQAHRTLQEGINQWNSCATDASDEDLQLLWQYVERYYIHKTSVFYYHPLPSIDASLLEQLKSQIPPVYLDNVWHRTLLWFDQDNKQWIFYDPERKDPAPQIYLDDDNGRSKLCRHLRDEALGQAIRVVSDSPLTLTTEDFQSAEHCGQFIQHGGLALLSPDEVGHRFYRRIMAYIEEGGISSTVLGDGLFLVNMHQKPLWYNQLRSFPNETIHLLMAANNNDQWQNSWTLLTKNEQDIAKQILTYYKAASFLLTSIPSNASCAHEKPALTSPDSSTQSLIIPSPKTSIAPLNPHMTKTIAVQHATNDLYLQDLHIREEKIKNMSSISSTALPSFTSIDAFDERAIAYATPDKNTQHLHALNNKLLQFEDEKTLAHYIHHLIAKPRVQQRGFFVINSLEELKCATRHLRLDNNNQCHIDEAPSGAFYDFLSKHQGKQGGSPIILINTSRFTKRELSTLNEFLGERKTDNNESLPEKAIILTLQNLDSKALYQGSDFLSRHNDRLLMPSELGSTLRLEKDFPDTAQKESEVFIVDFYNDLAWEQYLYGTLQLSAKERTLKPSPLFQALTSDHPPTKIVFNNVPDVSACHYAIMQFQHRGTLEYLQRTYQHPTPAQLHVQLLKEPWVPPADAPLTLINAYPETYDAILNPETFPRYFSDYGISEQHTLITLPGLIENHLNNNKPGQPLRVYLTRALPLPAWAKLVDFARTKNCPLIIHVASDVTVPSALTAFISDAPIPPSVETSVPEFPLPLYFQTNDTRLASHDLLKLHPDSLIVDIDEMTYGDLFYQSRPTLTLHGVALHETKRQLWQALQEGKTVILRGKCPPELADHLANFFRENGGLYHQGKTEFYSGKLIMVSPESDKAITHYLPDSRVQYWRYENPSLPATVMQMPDRQTEYSHCEDLSEETANNFVRQRQEAVAQALTKKIVTLLGHTGVGKSSFMHQLTATDPSKNIFFGENNILPWITAHDPAKQPILFIDEANLTHTDWTIFKTLFDTPPHIFYQGIYYTLSEQHRVIFAGNPSSYRGRPVPSLFQEHPNEVIFHSAPPAYLYHEVILPIIGKACESELELNKIGKELLRRYYALKQKDNTISQRELEALAFEYMLTSDNDHREYPEKINDFFLTPSHHALYHRIQQLIAIRSFKQNATHPKAQYGGYSGAILEGEPGVGKTFFLKSHLCSQGFIERNLSDIEYAPKNSILMGY